MRDVNEVLLYPGGREEGGAGWSQFLESEIFMIDSGREWTTRMTHAAATTKANILSALICMLSKRQRLVVKIDSAYGPNHDR